MKFVVAIDGTAASGKGTLAKKIANHFGFNYLDTGILYRIVAYNLKSCDSFSKISKQQVHDSLRVLNKNFNISKLRNKKITLTASIISKNKNLRKYLLEYQREFAFQDGGSVLDGRDIGTVVCPNADVKVFVDANIDIRAKRRFEQYIENDKNINLSDITEDLIKRDEMDKNRQISPMFPANDAFLLDTSNITVEEGLKKIISIISKKLEK